MNDFPSDDDAEEQFRALDDAAASELNAVSDQLFATTNAMQSVVTMSEPVRADAISIARDILRLLKVKFGEVTVRTGLSLKSREEGQAIGGLTAVGEIYSQLLAWARGVDATIMNDPSVRAAIDAFGVIGYMAKREALRIARDSKDMFLATSIAQQLDSISGKYLNSSEQNLDKLLERIEHGIDRVLDRVQDLTMTGAGISRSKIDLGGGMESAPIAGQSMQMGGAMKRNAETLLAEDMAAKAETARLAAQQSRARRDGNAATPPRTTNRTTARQARAAQPTATTNTISGNAPRAARLNPMRMMGTDGHHHDDEHHHDPMQQMLQQRLLAARLNAMRVRNSNRLHHDDHHHDHHHHGHHGHHPDPHHKDPHHAKDDVKKSTMEKLPEGIKADMLKGFKAFDMSDMKPVPESTKSQVSSQSVNPSSGLKPPPTPPVAPAIDPITNQPLPGKGAHR